jgi:hypothetical protein
MCSNPHRVTEQGTDGPCLNVLCASSKQNILGTIFFVRHTVSYIVCLGVWKEFITHIFEEIVLDVILFEQDGTPPHFVK